MIHRSNLARRREVRPTSARVGELCDNLSSIVHRQKKCLAVLTLGQFFEVHARLGLGRLGGDFLQLLDVEVDVALGHVMRFIADESPTGTTVKVLAVFHGYHL